MRRLRTTLLVGLSLVIAATGITYAQEPKRIDGGNGLQLAVYESGPVDEPAILFIHGITQSHLSWERQFTGALAEDFRLVALDLRGHGASEKPLNAAHYTDSASWAEDIASVIRSKSLDQPVLVGWSYGGYVIADYLRIHGDDAIGGIVLVGVSPRLGTEGAADDLGEEFLALTGGMLSDGVSTRIASTRAFVKLLTETPLGDDAFDIAFATAMMVPPEVGRGLFSRKLDNSELFAGIDTPTLVVHGGEDRIVRVGTARRMAETVPEAELLVYEGLGHAPFLEDPERFNRDLAQFVRVAHQASGK